MIQTLHVWHILGPTYVVFFKKWFPGDILGEFPQEMPKHLVNSRVFNLHLFGMAGMGNSRYAKRIFEAGQV